MAKPPHEEPYATGDERGAPYGGTDERISD